MHAYKLRLLTTFTMVGLILGCDPQTRAEQYLQQDLALPLPDPTPVTKNIVATHDYTRKITNGFDNVMASRHVYLLIAEDGTSVMVPMGVFMAFQANLPRTFTAPANHWLVR